MISRSKKRMKQLKGRSGGNRDKAGSKTGSKAASQPLSVSVDTNEDIAARNVSLSSLRSNVAREEQPYHVHRHGPDEQEDGIEVISDHPLIYSAPTVDSLGDESLLIHPHYAARTPSRFQQMQHASYGLQAQSPQRYGSQHASTTSAAAATESEKPLRGNAKASQATHLSHQRSTPLSKGLSSSTPPDASKSSSSLASASSAPSKMSKSHVSNDQSAQYQHHQHHRHQNGYAHHSSTGTTTTTSTSTSTPSKSYQSSTSYSTSATTSHGSVSPSTIRRAREAVQQQTKPSTSAHPHAYSRSTPLRDPIDKDFFPEGEHRDSNALSVAVRSIPISERSAFAQMPAPSISEWYQHAQSVGSKRKLSPSLQHLQILHKLQSISHIRQAAFSVSGASDVLFPGDDSDDDSDNDDNGSRSNAVNKTNGMRNDTKQSNRRRRRRRYRKNDGRYRSIDPIQATKAALPPEPPLLSHKKYRLPMRGDVGFPNTPMEQIMQKQTEIQRETQWEEASPRLIVLVTSDDIGTAVEDDGAGSVANTSRALHLDWNGGGEKGIPFAGPELLHAKQASKELLKRNRNSASVGVTARVSSSRKLKDVSIPRLDSKLSSKQAEYTWKQRQSMSVLAPPLDATYSRTLGWRPRPFHDRHPGMRYWICSPLAVKLDIGNIEPLVCSLTLYSLPVKQFRQHQASAACASNNAASFESSQPHGKLSEHFWFPAGDWDGKIDLNSLMAHRNAEERKAVATEWRSRNNKAVFSSHELSTQNGDADLHCVLQIYKMAHPDALAAYNAPKMPAATSTNEPTNSNSKSGLRKRFTKRFSNNANKSTNPQKVGLAREVLIAQTLDRANAVLEEHGAQFLTPLCFGIVPVVARENGYDDLRHSEDSDDETTTNTSRAATEWPHGQTQEMSLYACSERSESEQAFCATLMSIVATNESPSNHVTGMAKLQPNGSATRSTASSLALDTVREDISTPSTPSSIDGDVSVTSKASPSPKKKGFRRMLSPSRRKPSNKEARSPPPPSKTATSITPSIDDASTTAVQQRRVLGRANVFSSRLNSDFLQALLTEPAQPENSSESGKVRKLFVDVTGDSAIMMDPRNQSSDSQQLSMSDANSVNASGGKRSSLVRLPRAPRPCGYIQESIFREVMYLPPRAAKSYPVDVGLPYRSLINLLYLYPRHVRNESKHQPDPSIRYCIQIEMIRVQQQSHPQGAGSKTKQMTQVCNAFHNPFFWTGDELTTTVQTRLPQGMESTAQEGIKLHDEFKLRLPQVLDGTYSLRLAVLEVKFQNDARQSSSEMGLGSRDTDGHGCGVAYKCVAESTIRLSSSSALNASGGAKIATVIPNGIHRIKVGDFLLQLETRLVSNIHTTDPALASALRDFPSSIDTGGNDKMRGVLATPSQRPNKDALQRDISADSALGDVLYSVVFSTAIGSSLMSHFQPLLMIHLANLINTGQDLPLQGNANRSFLMENVRSLLQLLQQIKLHLLSEFGHVQGQKQIAWFLKTNLDAFDEDHLRPATANDDDADEDRDSEYLQVETTRSGSATTLELFDDDDNDDFDGGAIRKRKKKDSLLGDKLDLRISRTFSAMEGTGTPFSRVAYGATKNDRMRLEAEMDMENSRFTYLADDDETVVTMATGFHSTTDIQMEDAREAFTNLAFMNTPNKDTTTTTTTEHEGKSKVQNKNVGGGVARAAEPGIATSTTFANNGDANSYYPRSLEDLGFGRRVRSAAQVMLAPCVTPHLSVVLSGQTTSPANRKQTAGGYMASFGFASPDGTKSIDVGDDENKTSLNETANRSQQQSYGDRQTKITTGLETIDEGYETAAGTFRNSTHCPVLNFSVGLSADLVPTKSRGEYLYESLFVLWLQCWPEGIGLGDTSSASAGGTRMNGDDAERRKGTNSASTSTSKSKSNVDHNDDGASFFKHLDLLLPVCLKSLCLRYSRVAGLNHNPQARVIGDEMHLQILGPFVDTIARQLVLETLGENGGVGGHAKDDTKVLNCLKCSDSVLDFLIGLCTILHPAQMDILLNIYFKALRDMETSHLNTSNVEYRFVWSRDTLERVRGSRQLRIRAVERLAVLPNFLTLNYPSQLEKLERRSRSVNSTWKMQRVNTATKISTSKGSTTAPTHDTPDNDPENVLLPRNGWLAELLTNECLSICALSCEAVVAEAMAYLESHDADSAPKAKQSALKRLPAASLERSDLLMFQSIAIHSITCAYELLLRRHAMDRRYQTENCRSRIAAIFSPCIFERSLASVRWLARMEATHKVRSLWLLCFVYVLQEAPESFLRQSLKGYCDISNIRIHRFIRLLRLSSSTFQSFIDQPKYTMFPAEIDIGISPWLLQESFNTICATAIVVVEECSILSTTSPKEQKKMIQGILDLLLHILTTPHSSVTHLRALGAASQALDKFGIALFVEITGASLQNWIRIILSLMNSISLSVRSIAVDFVVSLFGSSYELHGNVDELSMIFTTLLPEVTAREVGLYAINGHVKGHGEVEKSVWPLRRSFADVEDTNPLDDERVDPQLSPILATFCRACQAMIDGVLIEMRLHGSDCVIVGTRIESQGTKDGTFDADEESLFEAANFFMPETSPLQRLRWLHTLKTLHESKEQWAEAAETLMMCAKTSSDSIPHLRRVWRPSRFSLWSDERRSLWLTTVGEELGHPERGNQQVMSFADNYLEPSGLFGFSKAQLPTGKLPQPSVTDVCSMLSNFAHEAVMLYAKEGGMKELAYTRLESLVKVLIGILDDYNSFSSASSAHGIHGFAARRRRVEDEASLRNVIAALSGEMAKLADSLVLGRRDPLSPKSTRAAAAASSREQHMAMLSQRPYFVRLLLKGKKAQRFLESTTLPTYAAWDAPCICRVVKSVVERSIALANRRDNDDCLSDLEKIMCTEFAKPILKALRSNVVAGDGANGTSTGNSTAKSGSRAGAGAPPPVVVLKVGSRESPKSMPEDDSKIYVHVSFVQSTTEEDWGESRRYLFREDDFMLEPAVATEGTIASTLIEYTVAQTFPCPLSRQRTLLTSEFKSFR